MTSVILNKPTVQQLATVKTYDGLKFLTPIRRWVRTQTRGQRGRRGCSTCGGGRQASISDSQLEAMLASLDAELVGEIEKLKNLLGVQVVVLPFQSGAEQR
jgi:hypothetical protein